VRVVNPPPSSPLLKSPPGRATSRAFAAICWEVIGLDMTTSAAGDRGASAAGTRADHLHFQLGMGVNCRLRTVRSIWWFALFIHHFPNPDQYGWEMVTVCRGDGLLAVEDMVASNTLIAPLINNRLSGLRDPQRGIAAVQRFIA